MALALPCLGRCNSLRPCGFGTQEELLKLPWPEDVLDHPSCQTWQLDGQVIFNGPRISVGIVSGNVVKKIPNPSTGRADYFGAEPLLRPLLRLLPRYLDGLSNVS